MRCAAGVWACWLWGGVSLNTRSLGWPSRRGQLPTHLLIVPEHLAQGADHELSFAK